MGGDDLGSEDEYLFDNGFVDSSAGRGTAISSGDDDSGSVSSADEDEPTASSKKRKGEDQATMPASSSKKKRKNNDKLKPTSSKNLMIHAGRGIALDSADAQASFLGTIYSHSMKMSGAGEGKGGESKDEEDGSDNEGDAATKQSTSFSFEEHIFATPKSVEAEAKKFQHNNLAAFLKSGALPSNKRLKNWKHPHSPMVLIVTLSARRAVELMKQLSSSFKLPIAKLFAKHMSVENQCQLLKGVGEGKAGGEGLVGGSQKGKAKGRCYSLAVGTPGRLLKLLRHERDEPGSDGLGALRLKHTEVVIIDCHEDSKGWTVCTLNDTSRELMEFMKEGVVSELEKRKGKIKLALF